MARKELPHTVGLPRHRMSAAARVRIINDDQNGGQHAPRNQKKYLRKLARINDCLSFDERRRPLTAGARRCNIAKLQSCIARNR